MRFAAAILSLLPVALLAQDISVRTRVEPQVVTIGQSAEYRVEILNSQSTPSLTPPQVDGLQFVNSPSISKSLQTINGITSSQISISYPVTPQREGTFTIPAGELQIRGQTYEIPEVTLRAVPMDDTLKEMFWITLDTSKDRLYVGESVPAFVKLYIRSDIRAGNLQGPTKMGDDVITTPLPDDIVRRMERVDNLEYFVLVWEVVLTPIKAGEVELSYQVTFDYNNPYRYGRDFFGRRTARTERITLNTGPVTLNALEVPVEARPESFSGAVGEFTFEANLSSRDLTVGDPVTLTMKVAGRGNFDRFGPPEIDQDGWRVYPPKIDFEARDEHGNAGVKTFEFILIPEREDVEAAPELRFSFFDPFEEDFTTIIIDAEPVEVAPAPEGSVTVRDFTAEASPDGTGRAGPGSRPVYRTDTAPETFRPIQSIPGKWHPAITVELITVPFVAANAVVLIGFASVMLVGARRQRLLVDEGFARQVAGTRAIREWWKKAEAAVQDQQTDEFLDAAIRCLQESAGRSQRGSVRPGSLVLSDIERMLAEKGAPEATIDEAKAFFEAATAARYGVSRPSPDELQDWRQRLALTLEHMERVFK